MLTRPSCPRLDAPVLLGPRARAEQRSPFDNHSMVKPAGQPSRCPTCNTIGIVADPPMRRLCVIILCVAPCVRVSLVLVWLWLAEEMQIINVRNLLPELTTQYLIYPRV